ncbi:MAG TPA: hypothetical protein VFZ77_18905 [Acidimicrobiales bacterium]
MMRLTGLSARDVEDIIEAGRVRGREDLDSVLELAAFMRASREVEPPPPMRADLVELIAGQPPQVN